jgi:pyridoxal phosphate-dependent aminotransferase EpsN
MRGGAVADHIFATGVCLPSGSSLTEVEQHRVIDAVRSILEPGPT